MSHQCDYSLFGILHFSLHSYFATLFFITTRLELEIPNSTFHVGYVVNYFNKNSKNWKLINILVVIMLIIMQWMVKVLSSKRIY